MNLAALMDLVLRIQPLTAVLFPKKHCELLTGKMEKMAFSIGICYLLFVILTGSQAEPGNRCLEALPRIAIRKIGGRASGSVLPGRAWERVD